MKEGEIKSLKNIRAGNPVSKEKRGGCTLEKEEVPKEGSFEDI